MRIIGSIKVMPSAVGASGMRITGVLIVALTPNTINATANGKRSATGGGGLQKWTRYCQKEMLFLVLID